jgi:hypothetical protein
MKKKKNIGSVLAEFGMKTIRVCSYERVNFNRDYYKL